MIVYICVNNTNRKYYIGITKNKFIDRIKAHERASFKPKYVFHHALAKHGIDNFHWSILDNTAKDIEELKYLEKFYIKLFKERLGLSTCYNSTDGGDGIVDSTGQIGKKISASLIGRKVIFSDQHRKNISMAKKGKANTKDHNEKVRLANLGKKQSEYTKNKRSESMKLSWSKRRIKSV